MIGPVFAGGHGALRGPLIARSHATGDVDLRDEHGVADGIARRLTTHEEAAVARGPRTRERVLLIGPCPPPECGTSIPFEALIDFLREAADADLVVISSTSGSKRGVSLASRKVLGPFFRITREFLRHAGSCDRFVFYGSQRFVATAGALYTFIASGLLGKEAGVYIQGGGFDVFYKSMNPFTRGIVSYCFRRARAVAVQTRQLQETLGGRFPNLIVLPNWSALPESRREDAPVRPAGAERAGRDLGRPGAAGMNRSSVPGTGAPAVSSVTDGLSDEEGKGAVRFLYLGQVKREKGVATLVRAFSEARSRLSARGCATALDIYGPKVDEAIDEVAPLMREVGHAIAYHGNAPHDQIASILRAHDVLVLPTTWPTEGYPAVVIEAMACGVPVIATRFRALPEIVIEESTGLLCEVDDPTSLAQCMVRLALDTALRERMGREAQLSAGRFEARTVLPEFCRAFGIALKA